MQDFLLYIQAKTTCSQKIIQQKMAMQNFLLYKQQYGKDRQVF